MASGATLLVGKRRARIDDAAVGRILESRSLTVLSDLVKLGSSERSLVALQEAMRVSTSEMSDEIEMHRLLRIVGGPVQVRRTDQSGVTLGLVLPGCFEMGSPRGEGAPHERPRHSVTLSRAFWCGIVPVTAKVFTQGERKPARIETPAQVSWLEAVRFCNRMTDRNGKVRCYRIQRENVEWISGDGYRLLTEAEWEFVCRAGTTTLQFWAESAEGLERYAWYHENSGGRMRAVGKKALNPWGFADLLGNSAEWCWDWFGRYRSGPSIDPLGPPSGPGRVLRGGAFDDFLLWPARRSYAAPVKSPWRYAMRLARDAG